MPASLVRKLQNTSSINGEFAITGGVETGGRNGDTFKNSAINTYRVKQGILNNPINEKKAEDAEVKVKDLKETHKAWKEEKEKENVSFKKIVNEQVLAKDEAITQKVIKVIKKKITERMSRGDDKKRSIRRKRI